MTHKIIVICLICLAVMTVMAGCTPTPKPDPKVDLDYSIYEPEEAHKRLTHILDNPESYLGQTLKISGAFRWHVESYDAATEFWILPKYNEYGMVLPFQLKTPWETPDEWLEKDTSICIIGTLQLVPTNTGGTCLALVNAEIVDIEE